jgi:hypothetical protein
LDAGIIADAAILVGNQVSRCLESPRAEIVYGERQSDINGPMLMILVLTILVLTILVLTILVLTILVLTILVLTILVLLGGPCVVEVESRVRHARVNEQGRVAVGDGLVEAAQMRQDEAQIAFVLCVTGSEV